jgi:hypothetical protein
MNTATLQTDLKQFTGTQCYWRVHSNVILTDGAKYLADKAGAYWLMDIIWSITPKLTANEDEFFVLALERGEGNTAEVVVDRGRGHEKPLYTQHIPFTDFPLESQTLYIQKSDRHFVVMLPSEY